MHTNPFIDFSDTTALIITFLLITAIIFFRFLVISGAYHYIFRVLLERKYRQRILQQKNIERKQILRELKLAFYSAWIFGGLAVFGLWLWQLGYLKIYYPLSYYPIWYIPLSIIIFLFLHDAYYYWLHRWMHHSKWLWKIHLSHHKSTTTSVLTAFSFHPIEAFLQAIFLPLFLLIVPISLPSLFIILGVMTLSATINHAGVEIYPKKSWNAFIYNWFIGATHHDIHHKNTRTNYGLYFRFWDITMGTEKQK